MSSVLYNQTVHLKALGGLRLGGAAFQKPKPLLLLCYLLVEGPTERRHLAELFWPGAANHLNSLSKALSQLRGAIPDALETDETKVWASLDSDMGEVLAALEADDFARATQKYGGPFLEAVFLRNWSTELEEWVYATREHLAGRVRLAHLKLAEAAADVGQREEALRQAEAAFTLKAAPPLDVVELERLHKLFLLGYSSYLSQLRAEAEGYGLELSAEKVAVERSPVVTEPSPAHSELPTRGTAFIGRELEIAELTEMLRRESCRLVTVIGPGGMGKTRIALEVVRQLQAQTVFEDIYFVELAGLADHNAILNRLAEVAKLRLQGQDTLLDQLTSHFYGHPSLLVFDNFEHVLEGADSIAELLGRCPQITCLITSREALHLEEEWLFDLAGLYYPELPIDAERLKEYDAINLFTERAVRSRRDFVLTQPELGALAELCQLVRGSPLALELAATLVRVMTVDNLLQEMRVNLDILKVKTRNIPDRHKSIRATFEFSWASLEEVEQRVLADLSVFQGGFNREAARAVADMTTEVLMSLLDKSLVQRSDESRFSIHPLLRQFLTERRALEAESARAESNHTEYFLQVLDHCSEQVRNSESAQALATFEQETDNILAVWHRLVAQRDAARLLGAAKTLVNLYFLKSSNREAIDLFAQALAQLGPSESEEDFVRLHGHLFLYQAVFAFYLSEHRASEKLIHQSLERLEPLGETQAIIRAWNLLGGIAKYAGDYERAKTYYQKAFDLALEQKESTISYLNNLGHVATDLGRYEEAHRHYEQALAESKKGSSEIAQASPLQNLGHTFMLKGDVEQAHTFMYQSLELARRCGFEGQLPYSFAALGTLALTERDYSKAREHALDGLVYARKLDDKLQEAALLLVLAKADLGLGEDDKAMQNVLEGLKLLCLNKDIPATLDTLALFARLRQKTDLSQAAELATSLVKHPSTRYKARLDMVEAFNLSEAVQREQMTPERLYELVGSLVSSVDSS